MLAKIGIFGGTFDPIHCGHVHLALQMKELHALDEVWFCPAWQNPFKEEGGHQSAYHRYEMVKLALQDVPGLKAIDIECLREGPSYTVDTLRALKSSHPNVEFYLILGEDAAKQFFSWRQPEEILMLATPILGKRSCEPIDWNGPLAAFKKGYIPHSILEISSTEIRKRLMASLYVAHLLDPKVVDYIIKNRLYSYRK